ncbi:type 2 lanthipeptide synthetase LanM family protein [Bacillus paramycoides]|uniref:type 2 lanthipeptide synthetase LanM family protein n=1 Tax=Bacillus paramycoides TaxID=2026194 RepID=UPI0031833F54
MNTKLVIDKALLKKGTYINERKIKTNKIQNINIESPKAKLWRKSGKFTKETFQERLKEYNLDMGEFLNILDDEQVSLGNEEINWINSLIEVLNIEYSSEKYIKITKKIVFSNFVLPFIAYADKLFINKANSVNENLVNWDSIRESILSSLALHLSEISVKILIKEIHISKQLGELEGASSESRYNYFNEVMLKDIDFITDILTAYPVLARLLVEKTESYINSHTEALTRYIKDYPLIVQQFGIEGLDLIDIESNHGDSHKNGRTVIIFKYNNEKKLVYKPRSMSVDEHFNDLLEWINCKERKFDFKAPKTKNCGIYGWQEFIDHKPCENLEQVELFYYRQGGYLALLYLLRSKDFHHENLIAHGSHPVLIDLETLFDNVIRFQDYDPILDDISSDYHDSVLGSAMLPFNFAKRKGMDLDFSALGTIEEGEIAEFSKNYSIDNENTDEIRLIEVPVVAEKKANLPVYNNNSIHSDKYIKIIESGFRTLYTFFLRNKKQLTSITGPIYKFKNDEIRHVFRGTNLYTNFIACGTHPDYLQDGLSRNRLFDILWIDVKNEERYRKFTHSECNDLLNQDVPYFTFEFGGRDLKNSKGDVITNFYNKTSLSLVLERCKELSLNDCRRQQRYIRMSLSTLNKDRGEGMTKPTPGGEGDFEHIAFLEEATKIGEEIANHIKNPKHEGKINNFAMSIDKNSENGGVNLSPLDEGIYDGLAGLALFFAQLAYEINDDSYKKLAEDIFDYSHKISDYNMKKNNISAYTGLGGIVYTAAYFHLLWGDNKYKKIVFEYLKLIDDRIGSSPSHDYLTGEAGALLLCLRIYKNFSHKEALLTAIRCGEYLFKSLSIEGEIENLLAGMSHGASGYAWPLMLLGYETGDNKFISIANSLIKYENTLFDKESRNWIDLRPNVKAKTNSFYWCHGAPGIALARGHMLSLVSDQNFGQHTLKEDLQIAIETTLENGFHSNHCLCHGDLGNIDILLTIAKNGSDKELLKKVLNKGYGILEQGKKMGWMNGIDKRSEMYGFMLGLSGIGFELLRLWNPNIPSVLDLELPS